MTAKNTAAVLPCFSSGSDQQYSVQDGIRHFPLGLQRQILRAFSGDQRCDVCIRIETGSRYRYIVGNNHIQILFLQFFGGVLHDMIRFGGESNQRLVLFSDLPDRFGDIRILCQRQR